MITTETASIAIDALIERQLRRAPALHVYELGDLDPREAAHTTVYANADASAVAVLYRGLAVPTLLAFADGNAAALRELLARHARALPDRFYAHLTPGLDVALAADFAGDLLGENRKLGLGALRGDAGADADVVALSAADAARASAFYAAHYPGHWFEPASLERGPYLALSDGHGLAAIAGVHVYSPTKRVAAIGNVATRGDARGRGLARRITGALCRRLRAEVDTIGLNVRADNAPALACYRGLGFEDVGEFREWRYGRRT